MTFSLSHLRVIAVRCARCEEEFPRPKLAVTLYALRCPRCGNLENNTPTFAVDDNNGKEFKK